MLKFPLGQVETEKDALQKITKDNRPMRGSGQSPKDCS